MTLRKRLYLSELMFDDYPKYYEYKGEPIKDIIVKWQFQNKKLKTAKSMKYGKNTVRAHGVFPVKDLVKYREYNWSRAKSRRSKDKWNELVDSIKRDGIREELIFFIGQMGGAKVAEGNHRLGAALELGIKKLPVRFEFFDGRVRIK